MNTTITTKRCCTCKATLPLSLFGVLTKASDGLSPRCKPCFRALQRKHYVSNPESIVAKRRKYELAHPEAVKESRAKSRKRHAESIALRKSEYRKCNRDRVASYQRKWHASNPSARARHYRTRYEKNPAAFAQASLARKLCRNQATPKWGNGFFIEEIYRLARLRTKVTGIKWEVDHIVPLRGVGVCGLHVEQNLRVVPRVINRSKGNAHA